MDERDLPQLQRRQRWRRGTGRRLAIFNRRDGLAKPGHFVGSQEPLAIFLYITARIRTD